MRHALVKSQADYCLWRVTKQALEENKKRGANPSDWTKLAHCLEIDRPHLIRKRSGEYALSTTEYLALATILTIDAGNFFEPTIAWIQSAARRLCGDGTAAEDIQAFVLYCIALVDAGHSGKQFTIVSQLVGDVAHELQLSVDVTRHRIEAAAASVLLAAGNGNES